MLEEPPPRTALRAGHRPPGRPAPDGPLALPAGAVPPDRRGQSPTPPSSPSSASCGGSASRLALAALAGEAPPAATVRAIQAQMEAVAGGQPVAGAGGAGGRGRGRSARAARRAACAPPRSGWRTSRSASGGGWCRTAGRRVLDAAAAAAGDALAVAVGRRGGRAPPRAPRRAAARSGCRSARPFLERAIEEIQADPRRAGAQPRGRPGRRGPARAASTTPATAPTGAWCARAAWASSDPPATAPTAARGDASWGGPPGRSDRDGCRVPPVARGRGRRGRDGARPPGPPRRQRAPRGGGRGGTSPRGCASPGAVGRCFRRPSAGARPEGGAAPRPVRAARPGDPHGSSSSPSEYQRRSVNGSCGARRRPHA